MSLIATLRYSADDARQQRPNPSKIPFKGDIRSNLASCRNAVERYRKFRDSGGGPGPSLEKDEEGGQPIGLERDMQAALRIEINQFEQGLTIIDGGAERSVNAGFIHITARDASGRAGQRAVAQILSYLGEVAAEEEIGKVRGILVASSFDDKAKAAARMVPSLILRKYSVRFLFSAA